MNRLNPTAAGLALGLFWAVSCFILVLLATYMGYALEIVELMGTVYWGVQSSLVGALLALPWAFVDGFIAGFLVVWIYNRFAE